MAHLEPQLTDEMEDFFAQSNPPPGVGGDMALSTADSPELASQLSEQALSDPGEKPTMETPPEGRVELPGGWLDEAGRVQRTAIVRELTGRDEERLARIDAQANFVLLLQTMVECGLESIGGHPANEGMVKNLLVGDRMALILGIRIATYGEELPMHVQCRACGAEEDLILDLSSDIPTTTMEHPEIRQYDVELRRGKQAVIQPLTAGMQDAIWDPKRSSAEMKSAVLERCVLSIDGAPVDYQKVLDLGMSDRKTLLEEIADLQPGPNLSDGVELPCQSCGREFILPIDLDDLFR